MISDIILRRRPGLLLCAGGAIPSAESLHAVTLATQQKETEVVLEVRDGGLNYRIENGRQHPMGPQFFANRKQTNKEPNRLSQLERSLSERSFHFHGREALLLICGEITLLQGRNNIDFHNAVSENLQKAVQGEHALILNPTHSRMGNCGTINAWRSFLSQEGRVYVSASNWETCGTKRQRPTATIHTLWHDGNSQKHIYEDLQSDYCYREWSSPL